MNRKFLFLLLGASVISLAGCQKNELKMVSLGFAGDTDNLIYYVGDEFDREFTVGEVTYDNIPDVIVTWSNGGKQRFSYGDDGLTFKGFDSGVSGEKTIDVTYSLGDLSISGAYKVSVIGNDGPVITKQPKFEELAYPNPADYTVAVEHPEAVASYQWQIFDGSDIEIESEIERLWVDLEGTTAKTDKLHYFGGTPDGDGTYYRCVITDTNGKKAVTKLGGYPKTPNISEYVPYIMLGERPILGGQTLDLKDTLYGTGKISLNANGDEVTLENIDFDNTYCEYSVYDAAVGLYGEYYANPHSNFTIKLIGKNKIVNHLWQPHHNASGLPCGFNWLTDSVIPNLKITGEGSLSLRGGTQLIYTDSPLVIDADIEFGCFEDHFNEGVLCDGFTLTKNHSITGNLNGGVVFTENNGNIILEEGSVVDVDINTPIVSVGSSNVHGFYGDGYFKAKGAKIDVDMQIDPKRYGTTHGIAEALGIYSKTTIDLIDSNVNIAIVSADGNIVLGNNVGGLYAPGEYIKIENSTVKVELNTNQVMNAANGFTCNSLYITGGSFVTVKTTGLISSNGISSYGGNIIVDDSVVIVECASFDKKNQASILGFVGFGLTFSGAGSIGVVTEEGLAFAIKIGSGEEKRNKEASYVPTGIAAVGATITSPKSGEINIYSMPIKGGYAYLETVFAPDSDVPSSSITLSIY